MARARNIKPGFYKNEDLAECSIWARFIFPGLWMLADRDGRLEDRPKRIKAELLAFDSQDVDPLLDELQARGFLVRYQNSDGSFIQISKFSAHQTPHYSEKKSVIKPPDSGRTLGGSVDDGGKTPSELQESSEKPPLIKRGSQPPDSLNPDSPNPGKAMSGNAAEPALPGLEPPPGKPPALRTQAMEVLAFLNLKTGRDYQPVDANLSLIEARIKEGATVQDCKTVVARKFRDWSADEKMRVYLRPATLFNATKFAQYRGECVEGT